MQAIKRHDARFAVEARSYKPWNYRNKGRGARFGRGGGRQCNSGPDVRKHRKERDSIVLEVLVNSLNITNPTEFTATIAPDMSAKVDEPGVMDSGANISITNYDVITKFNLQPQRWEQPFHIKFGNGSRFHCTHL